MQSADVEETQDVEEQLDGPIDMDRVGSEYPKPETPIMVSTFPPMIGALGCTTLRITGMQGNVLQTLVSFVAGQAIPPARTGVMTARILVCVPPEQSTEQTLQTSHEATEQSTGQGVTTEVLPLTAPLH